MKALGKILGLFLLGLLLIVVALLFALTHLFDPNDYKDEIRQIAHDKANLDLQLKGDIGWSLFPWLGLELTDATLASADTPDKPFADLRMIGLSVRVMPLLRKEVQMSDIRVDGLSLSLQRDAKGHGNWEGVGRPAKANADTPQPGEQPAVADAPSTEQPSKPASQPLKLDIDSLTLSNSRVDYDDAQKGQQFTVENIELKTGAIREGASIPVKFSAFFGTNQPLLRARSEVEGALRFDRALKRYQFEDLKLTGEASGEPLKGKTVNFSAQGQLLLDQAANIAEWNGLKLSANQLRALGELKVRELDKDAKLAGGISIAALDLRDFLDGLGVELPAMRDANSLKQFELVSRLNGSSKGLMLENLDLKLDGSSYTGSLGVADFAKQALRADLKGDKLDLDRYLPPKSKDSAGAARQAEVKESIADAGSNGTTPLPNAPTQQAWSDEQILPVDRLRSLDLQLALSLGQLIYDKQTFTDVNLKTNSRSGLITLEEARGKLQGGNFISSGSIDVRQIEPIISLESRLNRIPIEPFLKKQEQPAPLRGLLDLDAKFNTRGNSQKAWVEALNGNASFLINDGVLVNANLEQQLCRGIATLNRKTLNNPPTGKDTPFRELKGSLSVRDGVARNPDLRAQVPGLAVSGEGDLDLRVLGLDYKVGITIEGDQREMPDPACQVNERYVGIEWPLRCRGPLEMGAKACRLDQDGMGKIAARLAGNKLTEKLEEKLGDKVSPELKDALKGLFNR
ncbi:AsmA protein [Pseudomonas sp. 8Z]|uniref:AsmA family protein n=1 Tax=Pseudomonas sp. 8Z TaxID=2653166 RepID=UPI0012EFEB52|nr:AsmA family protein [Pseudomonas sp. 8Z]VXC95474.1 AsmA protein [Pseudomonas sp. 8Z]